MQQAQAQMPIDQMPIDQIPADPRRQGGARGGRRPGRVPVPLIITLLVIGMALMAATGMSVAYARRPDPSAFDWTLRSYWLLVATSVLLICGEAVRFVYAGRRLSRVSAVLVIAAILLAAPSAVQIGNWYADDADGPQDATATVIGFHERTSRDENDNVDTDWVLRLEMPDGATREWTFDAHPGIDPSPGDKVDVLYYPRTNVIASLDLTPAQ